mmetsp:Transcript_34924/g.58826  ORF Transcript_34924/g.58826 Transcript_34924/m.58826 type:complete len:94 (+) Transcript_34924:47-328(+)
MELYRVFEREFSSSESDDAGRDVMSFVRNPPKFTTTDVCRWKGPVGAQALLLPRRPRLGGPFAVGQRGTVAKDLDCRVSTAASLSAGHHTTSK